MKALVICVYMGPLPNYFALWLRSAAANPAIQWLLIHDRSALPNLPPNVSERKLPLTEVRAIFAQHLDFTPALDRPYKLCDFKPLFWMLAPDLGRYDFWGYCDLDVIWGKLDPLLEKCATYDSLLAEGHLRLRRNTPHSLSAFSRIITPVSWREALSRPEIFGIDEHGGINQLDHAEKVSWYSDPRRIADIDSGFRQFRLLPMFENFRTQSFLWENGRIFREYWHRGCVTREEFLYIHLQKRKLPVDAQSLMADAIDIGPAGFRSRNSATADQHHVHDRNPWRLPNLPEARILLREQRRRIMGHPSPFVTIDTDLA